MKDKKEELSEDAAELVIGGVNVIKDPKVDLKEKLHQSIVNKMKESIKKSTKIR